MISFHATARRLHQAEISPAVSRLTMLIFDSRSYFVQRRGTEHNCNTIWSVTLSSPLMLGEQLGS